MKELSIVIVNYNVEHFLQQCLTSIRVATADIDAEVWVVDNNSVDGSVNMVRTLFPEVHLIANADNPGFAKANNQALRQATGRYLLLLNPDTIVEPTTFRKCLDFMEAHPDCGGLGVKMINGEGKYLKESKRGFPSPQTSFYKISGLIHLFPHHKRIAAYYMGHLSDDSTNEVDILPGAYLMFRHEVMDRIGLLDESFFMYAEDIDFSWRIKMAGYKNYYYPEARIIHYKGESTKKGSLNYVYTFYNAMAIFARKYFNGRNAKFYNILIQTAIWMRAGLSFVERLLRHLWLPLLDFGVSYAGFLVIKHFWAMAHYSINYYAGTYAWLVLPLYVLVLMAGSWLAGGYEKPIRLRNIFKGMLAGALSLLIFYSLISEELRYSRAILLLGSVWSMVAIPALRCLLSAMGVKGFALRPHHRNYLLVGDSKEADRVEALLKGSGIEPGFLGRVSVSEVAEGTSPVGHLNQLPELIHYYKVDEVIFCGHDLSTQNIISLMSTLQNTGVAYKIVPSEADYIIGSDAITTTEDLYTIDLYTLASRLQQRNKRLLDVGCAVLLLILSPILLWVQRGRGHYFRDCLQVLRGKKSWVGYCHIPQAITSQQEVLPRIKEGVFTPADILPQQAHVDTHRLNLRYAKNYKPSTDLSILLHNINRI